MGNIKNYLGSPLDLSTEDAFQLFQKELSRKNLDNLHSIVFQDIGLNVQVSNSVRYIDLGFHRDLVGFAVNIDRMAGYPQRFRIPSYLKGSEYRIGGGRTVPFGLTDTVNNKDFIIWTTYYKIDNHTNVNLFLKCHEQSHVIYALGAQKSLINLINATFPSLDKKILSFLSEETIANISGLLGLRKSCFDLDNFLEVVRNEPFEHQDEVDKAFSFVLNKY